MKKYILYTILSFLIATSVSARKTGCEGNCENGLASGLIQTKLPMKEIGQVHKNMDKESKLGQMDTFIRVNLTKVTGVDKEF